MLFLFVVKWFVAMAFVIVTVLILYSMADHRSEKKYQVHVRLEELERWKAELTLERSRARRIRKARQETESREKRLLKDATRWRKELAADLGRDDQFNEMIQEIIDGAE